MPQIELFAPGPPLAASSAPLDVRPHILLVVDGFPKALGGGERVVLRLAALLPAAGFRVSILTFLVHPQSSLGRDNAPCPVYLLPLQKTWNLGALRAALSLRRFLRRERVALVQTFFESSDLWAGLVTRLASPAKLVWSRRDMGILRSPKHTRAYRALRRLPHAVMSVSQRVAEHVTEQDGVPAEKVHVIYNGLELSPTLQQAAPNVGPLTIATVGNIRRVKGHDLLIEAAREVVQRYPETQFSIAGEVLEPDYFAELQRAVIEHNLSANVRFVGKVTDMPAYLSTASIFALPSRSEGFSNSLLEAMAAGLPVVATDVGGNAEAVEDGINGFVVPSEDVPALTAALLRLCANPEERLAFAKAGRQIVEARFSAEAMIRNTVELYRQLL